MPVIWPFHALTVVDVRRSTPTLAFPSAYLDALTRKLDLVYYFEKSSLQYWLQHERKASTSKYTPLGLGFMRQQTDAIPYEEEIAAKRRKIDT